MASNVVTASLTVNFEKQETSGDGFLSWEVDDRSKADGGLNNGDTSFSPGDTVYVLLYQEKNVTLTETFSSGGSFVESAAGQLKSFTGTNAEYITVTNSNTANLSKPANSGGVVLSWIGRKLAIGGGEINDPPIMLKLASGENSEVIIDVGTEAVGVIKAEYVSESTAYKLSGVGADIPVVVIFASGTVTV